MLRCPMLKAERAKLEYIGSCPDTCLWTLFCFGPYHVTQIRPLDQRCVMRSVAFIDRTQNVAGFGSRVLERVLH